jgi:hypothetical protein
MTRKTRRTSGRFWRRLHLALVIVWGLLLLPSMTAWRESVPWLVFMSWYAAFGLHWDGWQASRAEDARESAPE